MITLDLIESAQKKWGDGIVKIGSLKNDYKLFFPLGRCLKDRWEK